MRLWLGVILVLVSVAILESDRYGIIIERSTVNETPITRYAQRGADGPVVLIAHGFAGSQQMMQGYALPLARAGYQVYTFGFLGHDRHVQPMSGDVDSVDGATRLLVDQTLKVLNALPEHDAKASLIGHSMATDILVRVEQEADVGPMVLISAFSQEITATRPTNVLFITGQGEGALRAFAQSAVEDAETTNQPDQARRKAVVAPWAEHVSVLHSRTGRAETVDWLDSYYMRSSRVTILPTGQAILAMFLGLVLVFRPMVRAIPKTLISASAVVPAKRRWLVIAAPAVLTPPIAVFITPQILPVMVADYLGVHLFLFGGIQLALLWQWRGAMGRVSPVAVLASVVWCCVFGVLLDRYVANFLPTTERAWIIALLCLGAVPYMLADSLVSAIGTKWFRFLSRTGFLVSLAIAVLLDVSGLFFLIMIAPVMVLFYLIFGTVGRYTALRAGAINPGLALGLVLAWALGVSFPLFIP